MFFLLVCLCFCFSSQSPLLCEMVLFFSFFSKLFQSWYHLLPSHAISYRTSYTSVLVNLIFIFDRDIYFLLKTLGTMFNHIFQLNCGKFFWDMLSHEVSFFYSCFFIFEKWVYVPSCINHLWMRKFFHDQLWVAGWSLQGFSLWLVVGCCMSSHCHYSHYVSPVIKASPTELSTMKISLLPTSSKARALQIWVMMFPEKAWFFWDWLSRISRHGHSSIYSGAAASSLQR